MFGTNVGIGSQGLVMFGNDAQKAKWLPGIASGEIITSFALTEPEAGSDSAAVQTRATLDGDDYVLNGSKRYITNAGKASLFTVMARTNPDAKGGGGVSAFLVPRDLPGLTVGKPEKKMGQQGAHIHDVTFDNVRVPAWNRLGEEGEGFKVAMQVLDRGRLHIAAVCVGVAERLIADCVAYASERKQFGQPIASFQLIQAMIADSKTEALAAKALVLETARKRDAGVNVTLEAASSQAVRLGNGRPRRGPRGADLRRRRLCRRLWDRAPVPRRAHLPDLRRHQPDTATDRRPGDAETRGSEMRHCVARCECAASISASAYVSPEHWSVFGEVLHHNLWRGCGELTHPWRVKLSAALSIAGRGFSFYRNGGPRPMSQDYAIGERTAFMGIDDKARSALRDLRPVDPGGDWQGSGHLLRQGSSDPRDAQVLQVTTVTWTWPVRGQQAHWDA